MLTSKPPFQSSTTDEIYRRARERDYEWPTSEASQKFISQEAKDLVATMLQDADRRPEPDDIIQHPFFTSGYMPTEEDMSYRLRELAPEREEFYASKLNTSTQTASYKNLKDMCRECGVGPWSDSQVIHSQIWREMAREEKYGLTPMIPLAENTVYRPFDDWLKENQPQRNRLAASVGHSTARIQVMTEDARPGVQKAAPVLLRQPPQSFAAQQRAQVRPAACTSSAPQVDRPVEGGIPKSQSVRLRSRQDVGSTKALFSKDLPEAAFGSSLKSMSMSMRSSTRTMLPQTRSAPSLQAAEKATTLSSSVSMTLKKHSSLPTRSATLFSSSEMPQDVARSQPDVILNRLHKLQSELERALNSRSMAIISSKTVTPPHPHVVVKWVDYTNKFGLGYILNDGSVGCVLRDIPTTEGSKSVMLPPAGIFIRGAEKHILRRQDDSYVDRNQPIPMTEHIKFFENNGENGLSEVSVSPEHFRVSTNEDGSAGKMNPGKDIYQHRKRERIILWKKFANYMIAYGRDENLPLDELEAAGVMSPGQKGTMAELVTFYQRFGDVGCWVFCDGHLQVRILFTSPRWWGTYTNNRKTVQLPRSYKSCSGRYRNLVSLLASAPRGS